MREGAEAAKRRKEIITLGVASMRGREVKAKWEELPLFPSKQSAQLK